MSHQETADTARELAAVWVSEIQSLDLSLAHYMEVLGTVAVCLARSSARGTHPVREHLVIEFARGELNRILKREAAAFRR